MLDNEDKGDHLQSIVILSTLAFQLDRLVVVVILADPSEKDQSCKARLQEEHTVEEEQAWASSQQICTYFSLSSTLYFSC